jgi:hypothetical protein
MKRGFIYKSFVYFLCFSILLLTGGFTRLAVEARGVSTPLGEMISTGEVAYETRESVWKKVEPAHFPIFQGFRIKTEKGRALIVLTENRQIEVGDKSLLSFQNDEHVQLFQGGISFRIPSGAHMRFRVGALSIGKSHPLQAAKGPLVSPNVEETVGTIAIHANGAATVRSVRGPLAVRDQDGVLLAAFAPRESLTIPSAIVSGEQGIMVAQAPGEYPTGEALSDEFLGLPTWAWWVIGVGSVIGIGVAIALIAEDDDGGDFFFLTKP